MSNAVESAWSAAHWPGKPVFSSRAARTRVLLLCGLLAVVSGEGGCRLAAPSGPPPYRVVLSPGYHPMMYRRLLFLPVMGLEGDPVAATLISDALLAELQTVGPFEVVVPEPVVCDPCDPAGLAPLSEADIAELAERYRPDAIVFTTITSYMPYPPMELGLSIRVVSAWNRETLASIDTVRIAPQDIPFSNGDCTFAHPASDLLLADAAVAACSPRLFARSVAMQIAHALALDPLRPAAGTGRRANGNLFSFWTAP